MVAPNEIPVYDYRAAILALAARDDSTAGNSQWFTLDSLSTSSQVDGDTAKVTLHAAGRNGKDHWSVDGGCFTSTSDIAVSTCSDSSPFFGLFFGGGSYVDASSQITAIRQGDRWFVSPVGTVLDVLDRWIGSLDKRTVYSLLGVPYELPPDGALTLGQPVALDPSATDAYRILTFDGHKGEVLVGDSSPRQPEVGSPQQILAAGFVEVRIFGPDDSELVDAESLLDGFAVTLPSDGRYTFEFMRLGRAEASATIWDRADAPASLRNEPSTGSDNCTRTLISESCSSAPVFPDLTPPSGIGGSSGSAGSGAVVVPDIPPDFCTNHGPGGVIGQGNTAVTIPKSVLDQICKATSSSVPAPPPPVTALPNG
jgi:hypothetical protein